MWLSNPTKQQNGVWRLHRGPWSYAKGLMDPYLASPPLSHSYTWVEDKAETFLKTSPLSFCTLEKLSFLDLLHFQDGLSLWCGSGQSCNVS